ncbi:MAG: KTSC domain-containing protein [Planctomycetota bacterium]|jgi:hypothetical protein|nr:KTSC domain-containing protein [Planctomycetota bacterium]
MPESFRTKSDALTFIESKNLTREVAETSRSSWIRSADYYHDESGFGYGVFRIRDSRYIHARLPRKIWDEFKSARSMGHYYNENIKGRYMVEFEQRPTN